MRWGQRNRYPGKAWLILSRKFRGVFFRVEGKNLAKQSIIFDESWNARPPMLKLDRYYLSTTASFAKHSQLSSRQYSYSSSSGNIANKPHSVCKCVPKTSGDVYLGRQRGSDVDAVCGASGIHCGAQGESLVTRLGAAFGTPIRRA